MQRPLRAAQSDLLAESYARRDYTGVAATGSGKGAVWLVPAVVKARVALVGGEPRALGPRRPFENGHFLVLPSWCCARPVFWRGVALARAA